MADALDAFSGSDEPGDRVAGAGGAGGAQGRSLAPTNISRDIRSNGQAPHTETNNRNTSKVEIQVVLLLQAKKIKNLCIGTFESTCTRAMSFENVFQGACVPRVYLGCT